MDKKKIEITEHDLLDALDKVIRKDKATGELIKNMPMLTMVFFIMMIQIWNQLTGENEEENNE